MVHSSGLFSEEELSDGMSPWKAGSYLPLPLCVSPHSNGRYNGSSQAAPTPMRSLLDADAGKSTEGVRAGQERTAESWKKASRAGGMKSCRRTCS